MNYKITQVSILAVKYNGILTNLLNQFLICLQVEYVEILNLFLRHCHTL